MLQNLRARKLDIPGAKQTTSPSLHAERLMQALRSKISHPHASSSIASSAKSLRATWNDLQPTQREWLSQVEGLDEVEELTLLLSHYCIARAVRAQMGSE